MSRKPSTEEAPPAEEEAAGAPAGVELEEALLSEGEVAPEVAKPAEEAPPAEVEAEAETAVVDGAAPAEALADERPSKRHPSAKPRNFQVFNVQAQEGRRAARPCHRRRR